eukprot:494975-Rhodomonas_salina.2
MVAMVVAALPCPPLPMIGHLAEGGGECMFDSHTLLRMVMLDIAYAGSKEQHEAHILAMTEAEKRCIAALDRLELPLWPPHAYTVFCEYVRGVLAESRTVGKDVSMLPIDHVCRNDTVHLRACDHATAHRVMYGMAAWDDGTGSFSCYSYTALVAHYAYSIIWAVYEHCVHAGVDSMSSGSSSSLYLVLESGCERKIV